MWTKELPTKDGIYWVRSIGHPETLTVAEISVYEDGYIYGKNIGKSRQILYGDKEHLESAVFEFQGPIEPGRGNLVNFGYRTEAFSGGVWQSWGSSDVYSLQKEQADSLMELEHISAVRVSRVKVYEEKETVYKSIKAYPPQKKRKGKPTDDSLRVHEEA